MQEFVPWISALLDFGRGRFCRRGGFVEREKAALSGKSARLVFSAVPLGVSVSLGPERAQAKGGKYAVSHAGCGGAV